MYCTGHGDVEGGRDAFVGSCDVKSSLGSFTRWWRQNKGLNGLGLNLLSDWMITLATPDARHVPISSPQSPINYN